jgi:2-methylisocitrate lyase-like PEP mutase family enzyme
MRSELARTFHRLHQGELLRLANAWDAGSARLIENLGAPAIATTSAGVAWSHGYPDGDALPATVVLATVAEIARAIRVPLSIDLEGGYSDDAGAVAELVVRVVEAGAVGINLEDGDGPPERLAGKIERIRRACPDVYVNARTDVYLKGLVPAPDRLTETIARGQRYRDAGASGLFVPAIVDGAEISAIVRAVALPLNVLAWAGLPPASELQRLGVRRLSAGSAIAQAVCGRAAALASAFLRDATLESPDAMGYAVLNPLFSARP